MAAQFGYRSIRRKPDPAGVSPSFNRNLISQKSPSMLFLSALSRVVSFPDFGPDSGPVWQPARPLIASTGCPRRNAAVSVVQVLPGLEVMSRIIQLPSFLLVQ